MYTDAHTHTICLSLISTCLLLIIAVYLTTLLAISTLSVCCAGIVLNIHHRDPRHPVPDYLRCIFSVKLHESTWMRHSTLRRKPALRIRNNHSAEKRLTNLMLPEKDSMGSLLCHQSGPMHDQHERNDLMKDDVTENAEYNQHHVESKIHCTGHVHGNTFTQCVNLENTDRVRRIRCAVSPHFVPEECKRSTRDSKTLRSAEASQDITWHRIGKSLDNVLFWIFFIITNTITSVIIILFLAF